MRDTIDNITFEMTKRNFFDAAAGLVERFRDGELSDDRIRALERHWFRY